MISELNLIGLPSKNDIKIDKSINVYVNQTQSQEQIQKQSIDNFIESIKDGLTGKQYKEIKEIISEELDLEKNKLKLLDKFKEFGLSVCASILANMITNPSLWTGIK